MDLVAHLMTRNADDGWRYTLAPKSAADEVHMLNHRNAPKSTPTDPALAAFHRWAEQ